MRFDKVHLYNLFGGDKTTSQEMLKIAYGPLLECYDSL